MTNSDVVFVQLDQIIDWSTYPTKSTACLLEVDTDISDALLTSIVVGAAEVGCTFFLTWGALADTLEDRIDEILENGPDDWLRISTISFMKEKAATIVINFLFVAAFPNRSDARYFVIADKSVEKMKEIVDKGLGDLSQT